LREPWISHSVHTIGRQGRWGTSNDTSSDTAQNAVSWRIANDAADDSTFDKSIAFVGVFDGMFIDGLVRWWWFFDACGGNRDGFGCWRSYALDWFGGGGFRGRIEGDDGRFGR
jgi:hypothetical protein